MASPTGGKFVVAFEQSGGTFVPANLYLNPAADFTPTTPASTNIEVFTASSVSGAPVVTDSSKYAAAINDANGSIDSSGYLRGSNLILGGGNYVVTDTTGGSAASINLGSGAQTIVGTQGDTLTGGGADGQILDARAGVETVVGGSGIESIWGGASDSIVGGTGAEQIVVSGSGTLVRAGSSGSEVISLVAGDTVTAAAGPATLGIGGGSSDVIDLSSNVAPSNAYSFVIGGTGDTITAGSGATAINAGAGGMSVQLRSGATSVTGANGVGGGDTVFGGSVFSGSFDFNPGSAAATGAGDLIRLGGSGTAVVNAFESFSGSPPVGTELAAVNDTIVASHATVAASDATVVTTNADASATTIGGGGTQVWGGPGDVIGNPSGGGAGHALFDHSSSMPGAVKFGTFDSVTGSSTASDTVTNFSTVTGANDSLFYPGESTATNNTIVASATSDAHGNAVVTLPDGTTMTLIGVTTAELTTLNTAGALFKPA